MDEIGIECVLAGAQATSVIDRANQSGSDWPRQARVKAGEFRATTRMRGDATMRRKYAELEKFDIGRRRAVATDRLRCLSEAEPWARA